MLLQKGTNQSIVKTCDFVGYWEPQEFCASNNEQFCNEWKSEPLISHWDVKLWHPVSIHGKSSLLRPNDVFNTLDPPGPRKWLLYGRMQPRPPKVYFIAKCSQDHPNATLTARTSPLIELARNLLMSTVIQTGEYLVAVEIGSLYSLLLTINQHVLSKYSEMLPTLFYSIQPTAQRCLLPLSVLLTTINIFTITFSRTVIMKPSQTMCKGCRGHGIACLSRCPARSDF